MNKEKLDKFEEFISNPEVKTQLKKLVLERINVMPDSVNMAVGSSDLTKEDVLEHVRNEDDVGKQIMEMELDFLRDLASGAVYANE